MVSRLKWTFGYFIIILLLAFAVSCGGNTGGGGATEISKSNASGGTGSNASESSGRTPYKIDVFTQLGNFSGNQPGWYAKIIRDKFNIQMNIISSNVEGGGAGAKFATMMASGDLGDVVIFGSDADSKWFDAINGGYLLDMTKNGLLDKYGGYIEANYPKVIEKNKTLFGGGKAVYGLGYKAANTPPGPSEGKDMTEHSDMRWDLYEKLGMPAINSPEDMLKVWKDMQKLEPRTEDGKPTYALTIWNDWDDSMMMYTKAFATLFGYDEGDGFNVRGFLLVNPGGEMQGCLDSNGWYLRTLKLFFKANQMGLVDPDSISQKFDDAVNKYKDGQLFFCLFPWVDSVYNTPERLAQGKAMYFVPIKGEKVISYGFNSYGNDRLISIGANAEHPDRIMELINWRYTPEGFSTIVDGPKGLTWDIGQDGKPYLTEFGKKALPGNQVPVPEEWGGGSFRDGQEQWNIDPVDRNSPDPEFNEPYDSQNWKSVLNADESAVLASWRKAMGGALTTKDYLVKNNMLAVKQPVFTGKAPEMMPDILMQKQGQVSTVIKEYSWKCIFASNEAEFNSLLETMVTKAKGLGYDEVLSWNKEHCQQVLDFLKSQNR